jgi:hypothetical protein
MLSKATPIAVPMAMPIAIQLPGVMFLFFTLTP